MITSALTSEVSLSTDAYPSIAFKGQSAQQLAETVATVRGMSHSLIYPPDFATCRHIIPDHGISPEPQYAQDAPVSPAEAAAIQIISDEGSAIAQNMGSEEGIDEMIKQGCDIGKDGSVAELTDGIADFGYSFIAATKVRGRMRNHMGPEEHPTMNPQAWNRFQGALMNEGLTIKGAVVQAIIDDAASLSEEKVRANSQKEEDVPALIHSRKAGIETAARIYSDVYGKAVHLGLSSKIS